MILHVSFKIMHIFQIIINIQMFCLNIGNDCDGRCKPKECAIKLIGFNYNYITFSNYRIGFVSIVDREYPTLAAAAKEAAETMYDKRSGK